MKKMKKNFFLLFGMALVMVISIAPVNLNARGGEIYVWCGPGDYACSVVAEKYENGELVDNEILVFNDMRNYSVTIEN